MSVAGISYRGRLQASLIASHRKGAVLSHLLGFVIASEFVVGSGAGTSVPYVNLPLFTGWLDFPLRMIGLWLLLDRNWRIGRLKLGVWDFLALAFPLVVAFSYPVTALDPSVGADFESYRRFLGTVLRFYLIYLLMREGYNRAGFRGDIVLRYILGALALSSLTAILQFFDVGSARLWTIRFFHLQDGVDFTSTGFRARGFAAHWNGFASEMVLALILLMSPLNWRRLRLWEYGLGVLYVVGLILSTSRGGYLTAFAVALAAGGYFLWTGRRRTGFVVLGALASALLVFGAVVLNVKSPLFHDLLEPTKVRSTAFGSLDYRLEHARRLVEVGMRKPITGTGPSLSLYDSPMVHYYSQSSVQGVLDVSYAVVFAQFGMIGLLYIGGLIYSLVRFGGRRRSVHPYALMGFLVGIAFGVDSLVEIIFITQPMILVSLAAGCAMSRVSSYSHELRGREFGPSLEGDYAVAKGK